MRNTLLFEFPYAADAIDFVLLDRARRKSFRIWAEKAPFQLKDALKARRYRWNDGTAWTS